MHGGKTPIGAALPQFRTGRYSRALPARLAARYQEARTDPALLELRDEVSLVDARLSELLAHLDTLGDPASWEQARTLWKDAQTESDPVRRVVAEHALDDLLNTAVDQYAAWSGVSQAIEQRRRLVESERKRLVEMQQMITTEQAMVLLAAVVDTVRRHVHDRGALAAISAELVRLTDRTTGGTTQP